ncbi:MAG: DUF2520 domain-containing protein [Bdellovibrionaceae bacterium]|nr:DUF2520 domain-containing protein [Pseudobdellovibrionaceae bacterium]
MNKYLIIGAGKLAKHLEHYLKFLDCSVTSWDRSQDPHLFNSKLHDATHILLAISDSALKNFYCKYLDGLEKTVVHFSGALHVDGMIAAHPLMTFGPQLYELEMYRRIHFVLTGAASLQTAIPDLPNSFSLLSSEKKSLYHALCVMAGNFPIILWQKMFFEFEKLGISTEAPRVYLEAALKNSLQNPQTALTGPLARKDRTTIQKNIEALENDPFQEIYLAFVKTIAPELLTTEPLENERSL